MSEENYDVLVSCTPELKNIINCAVSNSIPKNLNGIGSMKKCYSDFRDWCNKKKVKTVRGYNLFQNQKSTNTSFYLKNTRDNVANFYI
jgi:hypothetical protein